MEQCREEAEGMWREGKPVRWYYAVPVVLFWLAIAYWIVRAW
jgi:hypothetical protein